MVDYVILMATLRKPLFVYIPHRLENIFENTENFFVSIVLRKIGGQIRCRFSLKSFWGYFLQKHGGIEKYYYNHVYI